MSKPLALDLFCGGGGTCEGLMRAGFDVVGMDIVAKHAKNYPGTFVHGDALNPPFNLSDFAFVWASPPCQRFSQGTGKDTRADHPNLIEPVRALLADHPYTVIENVPPAPIRPDIILTGPMVGLRSLLRRRHFETSFFSLQPPLRFDTVETVSITKKMCATTHYYRRKAQGLSGRLSNAEAKAYMGIEHNMTQEQIGEAVPPAYAEFIGRQVMERLT